MPAVVLTLSLARKRTGTLVDPTAAVGTSRTMYRSHRSSAMSSNLSAAPDLAERPQSAQPRQPDPFRPRTASPSVGDPAVRPPARSLRVRALLVLRRSVPVTTMWTLRLPHRKQTSRSRQSRTGARRHAPSQPGTRPANGKRPSAVGFSRLSVAG
jgi:hypothetical protein